MVKLGFLVRLEVKEGRAEELEARFKHAQSIIEGEAGTTAWFAVRVGPTSYVVFDVFPDEASRQAHFEVGAPGLERLNDLLVEPASIAKTVVVAAKLPG
ncbi:antibiotic biosynthesis monooxygenase [Mesorhizobium sp. dw_380]|uniref:putative quinol monooxygenase n=1 Tax=Mesorhizobium sp. dw_380 TaxID=2812001 RepID=UPI001BDEADCA|nr:antibiotic biosynthesis monooxygenase [Mesorhizobium sp. dw_380]